MIRLILDIVLLVIVALCTWTGYRKGLIAGIAGITTENYQQVLATGADGVAVVSGILGADSIAEAVKKYLYSVS